MKDAYIIEAVRTPGCRRGKGGLSQTRPETLLTQALQGLMQRARVDKSVIDEIMIGCSFPEAEQGLNIGRIGALMAGFPQETTGATVNRFCASGIESVAISALRIMAGWTRAAIGGGIESMSIVPMGGNLPRPHPRLASENPDVYISMGITAENVARRYGITRAMQDEFAYHSQMKAAHAQKNGLYTEIIPVTADRFVPGPAGIVKKETFIQDFDDGVRADTTVEGLSKLKGAFAAPNPNVPNQGSVTAGNSSQTTDGAAAVLLMSEEAAKEYGARPIAKLRAYTVVGVNPDEMGVGPKYAVPKLLKLAGIDMQEIVKNGLIEFNEAFAAQSVYCLNELGLGDRSFWASDSDERIINVNGGAIALGHPLGCTGSKLAATLLANMRRLNKKWGVETMCVGGGMGGAALFELL